MARLVVYGSSVPCSDMSRFGWWTERHRVDGMVMIDIHSDPEAHRKVVDWTGHASVPTLVVAPDDGFARQTYPAALVLSRETGYRREYSQNPYSGYDRIGAGLIAPSSFEDDGRIPLKGRVLTVEIEDDSIATGFDTLFQCRVVSDIVGGVPVVAFWQPGTATPLDGPSIASSRDVGAGTAFRRELHGDLLEFEARDGHIFDSNTGSRWSVTGLAVEGPLTRERLQAVVAGNHFWFVWAVFKPETRVIR